MSGASSAVPLIAVLVVSADDPGAVELTAAVRRSALEASGRVPEIVTFDQAVDADVRISRALYAGPNRASG